LRDMDDILFSVIGWVVILGSALWYVRRIKHPARKLAGAFGLFLGIFGGITIATLVVVVGIVYALGMEHLDAGFASIGAVLALAVIIPAWRFAVAAIRRPYR
jgi:hypothetical protein